MQIYRRSLLQSALALGASQIVAAPFVVRALGDEPIKIGMVNSLTGVLAALAQSEVNGAKYAAAEINKNGGILGRPVNFLVEDSANDIQVGMQKAATLIERDNVSAMLGDLNSGVAFAIAEIAGDKKIIHIVPGGRADPLTGTSCKWNVFRICNTTTMDANAVTPELVTRFGNKWYFISPDFAYGRTLQGAFVKALTQLGGTYDGDSLPFDTTNFSLTLTRVKTFKPNVVLNNMIGPAQIGFAKQFAASGMQKDMMLGGGLMELESIKTASAEAQTGWWGMEWWWNQPNMPAVAKFVANYRHALNKTPSARDWFGYVAMHSVRLAAEKAKSLEAPKLAAAMEDMTLPPEIALQPGEVRYRAGDHQLLGNIFFGEVHPPQSANKDDVFNVATLVSGESAVGSIDDVGCQMEHPD
ncbi:MAG TPA: ABC transporter substrate-binding protein [Xanthobacteraceae bacterium]|nr:ABC transporter substrate-binding protein [Xanthobacteraceae bacterium]